MGVWVLLQHTLPDATAHFDWLIDPGPGTPPWELPSDRTLVAWRLDAPPFRAGVTRCHRLPPHRRLYLAFEGYLSGNRGRVDRLASGWGRVRTDTPYAFDAELFWGGRPARAVATPVAPGCWQFRVERDPGEAPAR